MKNKLNKNVPFHPILDCVGQEPKDSSPAEECDGEKGDPPPFPS